MNFSFNIQDVLDGKAEAPVMPGPNPFPLWTHEWFAWKEVHEDYVPYHGKCSKMPRVKKTGPKTFTCPACGASFPTSSSKISPELLEAIRKGQA